MDKTIEELLSNRSIRIDTEEMANLFFNEFLRIQRLQDKDIKKLLQELSIARGFYVYLGNESMIDLCNDFLRFYRKWPGAPRYYGSSATIDGKFTNLREEFEDYGLRKAEFLICLKFMGKPYMESQAIRLNPKPIDFGNN